MSELKPKFTKQQITDEKRLVRGEHLLFARSLLQGRDAVHHAKWRVLMLAGGAPQEEISAIRVLMPKAQIIAADRNAECLDRAIEAGADDVIHCDLGEADIHESANPYTGYIAKTKRINASLIHLQRSCDLVDLDLCSNASRTTREVIKLNHVLVSARGVFMVTFSYGRDVVPLFWASWNRLCESPNSGVEKLVREKFNDLLNQGCPKTVLDRICYLFDFNCWKVLAGLRAVSVYQGSAMPMCSVVLQAGPPTTWTTKASFLKVGPGDYELAAVYPESIDLYACPKDRIEALRRKFAAIKAAYTRMEKVKESALAAGLN